LSYKYKDEDGDIYSKFVYPEFYEMMVSGQTKQWNGVSRKKERSNASFKAEKQNYKIPLVQLGLWDSKTGKPTIAGIRMREISALYGVESEIFLDSLANMLLIEGKHFDLIKDISDFQKNNREIIPEKSEDFFLLLDDYLMKKGAIGTRKPSAIKTGAKKTYVRDEPKLWNKFGLLLKSGTAKYFVPFEGIKFNWNRISKLITIEIDK